MTENSPPTPPPLSPLPPRDNENNTKNLELMRATVKVPPFWADKPEIWFAQIEAQFVTCNITTDISKYNTLLGAIEANVLTQVQDAVLNPPDSNKYQNLKKTIIEHYDESAQKKIRKLLSEVRLGDKKPSQLYNEMKSLAGASVADDYLQNLWLQSLPQQIQDTLVAFKDDDCIKLLTVADTIMETFSSKTNSIDHTQNSGSPSVTAHLERKIETLSRQLENLMRQQRASRTSSERSSTPTNYRFTEANSKYNGFCWYHNKYGETASRCKQPCKFSQSKKTPERNTNK